MAKKRKSDEASARQLLNWMFRNLVRLQYNPGDGTVSVCGSLGYADAPSRDPAAVEQAVRMARARDIRERARNRRDKRDGVWPYNRDR